MFNDYMAGSLPGDYYVSRASCNVKVMVRAAEETTVFTLYITYDGQTWESAQTETVRPTWWDDLNYSFAVSDEQTAYAIRQTGNPVRLDWIAGIKVTSDDGGGERPILTVLGRDLLTLDVSLVDGEFDTVFEFKPQLSVETWVEWKHDLIWPENKDEDVVLYTVGQAGGVPMVGQSIPADYPLAVNKGAADGVYEV